MQILGYYPDQATMASFTNIWDPTTAQTVGRRLTIVVRTGDVVDRVALEYVLAVCFGFACQFCYLSVDHLSTDSK
jgi:hypothetical protein